MKTFPRGLNPQISIRTITVVLVVLTMVFTAVVSISLQHNFCRQMARDAAIKRYQRSADSIGTYIKSIESRGVQIARVLSKYPLLGNSVSEGSATREVFAELMLNNPVFYSVYLGFDNGDFYGVINLQSSHGVRQRLSALPEDRWVVNTVSETDSGRVRTLYYYDAAFRLRHVYTEPSRYDSTQRPWYRRAKKDEVVSSPPYLFQFNQLTGKSFSIRLPQSKAVLSLDVTLQSFSEDLLHHKVSDKEKIYLFNSSGLLIASNQIRGVGEAEYVTQPLDLNHAQRSYIKELGTVRVSNDTDWPPLDFAVSGSPRGYMVDVMNILSTSLDLKFEHINGYAWPEFLANFKAAEIDVLQAVPNSKDTVKHGPITQPILSLPFSVAVAQGSPPINHLQGLEGKTVAVVSDWSSTQKLQQVVPGIKVVETETPLASLMAVANGMADATIDFSVVLASAVQDYFIHDVFVGKPFYPDPDVLYSTLHIQVRPEYKDLIPLLNLALENIEPQDWELLEQKWLGKPLGRESDVVPYYELLKAAQDESLQGQLQKVPINGVNKFIYVENLFPQREMGGYLGVLLPEEQVLGESRQQLRTSLLFTSFALLLLLPLAWWCSSPLVRPIQALKESSERIKARKGYKLIPSATPIKELQALSKTFNSMAESIDAHEQRQQELLDSFIQIIANAIDEKSPYTGEHCERVPEIGLMLAKAAQDSNSPPFSKFSFNENQWREFRIAAWLHDCGKITTPEHIVDKGTKLESIYNRIHEIRMRFEVLWRDAHIEYLEKLRLHPDSHNELAQALQRKKHKLQQDFAYIASVNQGRETSDADMSGKLTELSQVTWLRYFDNRLGLSPVEERRQSMEEQLLPVIEPLLADKPEHIIPRERLPRYPPHLGITMTPPEQLYNRGEIYNLSIRYGTLTAEDRFKINEHVIATIKMLDGLPFPPELKNVPRYASTHHESMDGGGYPRGLSAKDLSIPERLLMVADIFEALTARDRPYKKAKTLSEAISILSKMVDRGHVDKDVFHLLLESGVYLQYAQQFLPASQIDRVDVEQYLR